LLIIRVGQKCSGGPLSCIRWLLILASLAAQAQETQPVSESPGPAVPGRSVGGRLGYTQELLRLRPYASIAGVYDTGLTGVFTDEAGRVGRQEAYGVLASFGVLGYHAWRRTVLGLAYDGSARHYTRHSYYDGLNQSLGLNLTHQASRRVSIELNESAASHHGGFYGLAGSPLYSQEFEDLRRELLFDTRTLLLSSSARLVFQKSLRLSMSAGGNFIAAQPRTRALVRLRGTGAVGDIAYRLTRRHTVGVMYDFLHFWYLRAFGDAWAHGAALQHSYLLSRRWTLSLRGGGYRVETTRLHQVQIDPAIAAIIGQRTGIEVFHRITYVPNISAGLSMEFERGSFGVEYRRGISSGNGIYLTSARESAGVYFGYTGTRRLHFSAHAGYTRLSSLAQTLGRYRGYNAGAGVTYRLGGPFSTFARVDGRKYNLGGTGFGRTYYRSMLGLSISPGEFPLALW